MNRSFDDIRSCESNFTPLDDPVMHAFVFNFGIIRISTSSSKQISTMAAFFISSSTLCPVPSQESDEAPCFCRAIKVQPSISGNLFKKGAIFNLGNLSKNHET